LLTFILVWAAVLWGVVGVVVVAGGFREPASPTGVPAARLRTAA